jgi:hypothetical protein
MHREKQFKILMFEYLLAVPERSSSARYETKERGYHKEQHTEEKITISLDVMLCFEGTYRLRYQGGRVNRRSKHHADSAKISILHNVTPQNIRSRDGDNRRSSDW